MVELQILSRVLTDRNLSLLTLNGIDRDYFVTYAKEYDFIINHHNNYGNVPDVETFLSNFPNFSVVSVAESDKYLIDTFNEEYLYAKTVPVLNKLAELMQSDSRAAVEYLQSELSTLSMSSCVLGTDIISEADERLRLWLERQQNPDLFFIPTGFEEIDDILNGGWQRGEEFAVIFARTGQGKTWILLKCLEHANKIGYRVGLVEPEMSAVKTGYRYDTLHGNISNSALSRGDTIEDYESYIHKLSENKVPFFVVSPKDFRRKVTVSKLRSFIEVNKLDLLAVDGISYLTDERAQRGDSRTTSLSNISQDLMDMSVELRVPILVVCQSNREGAKDDDAPDLENIRDSDGIAYSASTVLAIKQKSPGVEVFLRKNRNGRCGDKILYLWDIDTGIFKYVPDEEENRNNVEQIETVKKQYKESHDVF